MTDLPLPLAKYPPGFERWWAAYPAPKGFNRKRKKPTALRAWKRYCLEAKTNAIIALLERYKRSNGWTKDEGKWVPMPSSWLNAQPWNDVDPLAEQEEMAAHSRRIAKERVIAAQNPVIKALVDACTGGDEEANSLAAWGKLTFPEKQAAWDQYQAQLPSDAARRITREFLVRRWWSKKT